MLQYEVETKVKVKNINELRKKVKQIATYKEKQVKSDEYFTLRKSGKYYPEKAFRIRKVSGKYIVNFKKWNKSLWDKQVVVKEEYEFELKHRDIFLLMLKDLGMYKWINKTKMSETYQYKKNSKLSIELNKVKKLGWFMEIEYLTKSKSEIKKAKILIKKVLKQLNIKQKDIDNTGYTKMLWGRK
ncbi:MAG: class IV adenylate cyclase [Candidatus Nanoarchaeia archaeon]